MTRIVWGRPEERKFEAGVEKGVLYVGNNSVTPWDGLISVSSTYSGGDVEARYQDGEKVYDYVPKREFQAAITAYTYPEEFEECLGLIEAQDGIFIDEQNPRTFGVTYQTRVGDSVEGDRRGYKIHLIYNAIATINETTRTTIAELAEPTIFSWNITTVPIAIPGYRPSAHFVIDPSKIGERAYKYLHDSLYGAPGVNPRLLSPLEILQIIGDWQAIYPSYTTYPSDSISPGAP